jgi:1-acyl-sn-glycerol-3-phosphate acyltransferase
MSLSQRFLVMLFRTLARSVFRIHDEQLQRVPARGPLIIVMNHINILEIPYIYSHLQPRPVHGLVLADRWKNPVVAWGLNACGSIPLQRGAGNVSSISKALDVLAAGEMILLMPEGTRSGHGRLGAGYPGVVLLALKSGAPILPVATHGSEKYKANLQKLRRTDFYVSVGTPFYLEASSPEVGALERKQMLDEIMFRLAALLPDAYRGAYADPSQATQKYLKFHTEEG